MTASYWSRATLTRLTRRGAISLTGGGLAGAALLAACGGGSSNKGTPASQSSLIVQPVDTTKQAKRGGVHKWFFGAEPASLDVAIDQAAYGAMKNLVYAQLTGDKAGFLKPPSYEEPNGDMAESWEWSPDRLQLTFKLRQGIKWHNKAPINGRPMDVEDVVFSWNRYAAKATGAPELANSANPNAPVLSFTAVDANTVVLKIKEPVVYLVNAFGHTPSGKPIIVPKETDTTFDIKKDMIGTGPFTLEKYAPSVSFSFKRNQDYYDKTFPFFDAIEAPIVPEYATALAQHKAGNIYTYTTYQGVTMVRAEDILPMKQDVPDLNVYSSEPSGITIRALAFGWQPSGKSPFLDERVRQAVSMSWDRDAYIDTFNNVSKFEAGGLPVKTYWNSAVYAGAGSWWLDPKGKDFGPNAQYYKYDPAEAKKLLSAAGYANGLDTQSNYIAGPQLGADFQRQVSVLDNFASQAGIRPKVNLVDYTTTYLPTYRDGNGKYEGWSYRIGQPAANDVTAFMDWRFSIRGGAGFLGFDAAGKGDSSGDPYVESQLSKARSELDIPKRKALINDLQRYLAKAMYCITDPGTATNFLLAWPVLGNFNVYQGDRRGINLTQWIDDTKAPLRKA